MRQLKEFFAFVKERHAIYERRQASKPKPWTKDPILQSYRFCNAYRELDRVTIWIRENWREPWKDDPNVWFAMVVARLVNKPDALAECGYPVPWKPKKWAKTLDARKDRGQTVFSAAYMIHADAHATGSKVSYLAERVLTPLWDARKDFPQGTLEEAHKWLMGFRDMGSFMAAQIIADVKYTPLLSSARDWWTFAAPGPGSLKGMSFVEFGDPNTKYTDREWRESLDKLHFKITPLLDKAGMPRMHAQDAQNNLCEYSKYARTRDGLGRPKQKYAGT